MLGQQRAQPAVGRDVGGVGFDDQLLAIEDDQVRLRHVVPERVKEARRDHLGARRQFGRLWRVEAQQVHLVVRRPGTRSWAASPDLRASRTRQGPAVEGGSASPLPRRSSSALSRARP